MPHRLAGVVALLLIAACAPVTMPTSPVPLSRTVEYRFSAPLARAILAPGGPAQAAIALDDLRRVDRPARAVAQPKATVKRQAKPQAKAKAKPHRATYRGRNHFWFLSIDQAVVSFPCSRSKAPGNRVYRWGCAGSNNVYLMAHDFGKFYPLYKAYKNGRLRKGMIAVYADPRGKTHYYKLSFYKVVPPDGDVGWAYASTSRSALTLQTCVSGGKMRLVVRFYE